MTDETVPLALFKTISQQAQQHEDELDLIHTALRAIHVRREVKGVPGQTNDTTYCRGCSNMWPCPTMQVLDPALHSEG